MNLIKQIKDSLGQISGKKPAIVRDKTILVDNGNSEISAITTKIAGLVEAEASAAAAHARAKEDIIEFRKNLEATVQSHLADLDQLYGTKGDDREV
jgi:hypothetical protein